MDVNKESILGTRPWKVFGEGPASVGTELSAQGFNVGRGNFEGSWTNLTFGSFGKAVFEITLVGSNVITKFDLDGQVFGMMDPPAMTQPLYPPMPDKRRGDERVSGHAIHRRF